MRVNIKQVAEAAKVSTATVSHVINETRYVSDATRERVLKAMKELNYRPSSIARSLRRQKTNIIGLIMPVMVFSYFDYYFMQVAHGIYETFKKFGYTVFLGSSNNNIIDEIEQIKIFNAQRLDGLIILPIGGEDKYLRRILSENYPVVFIDRGQKVVKGTAYWRIISKVPMMPLPH
jgi:LacI family transcriptional regulator